MPGQHDFRWQRLPGQQCPAGAVANVDKTECVITCLFLMSVNPDPATSTDVPCVCEKDTFAIGSEAYAYW